MFIDVIKSSDINLNEGIRGVLYNQCIANMWELILKF